MSRVPQGESEAVWPNGKPVRMQLSEWWVNRKCRRAVREAERLVARETSDDDRWAGWP